MGKLDLLNSVLHKIGFELARYNKGINGILRRGAIFEKFNIDLIIDVGANTGLYGKECRQSGYKGQLISYEPLTNAFEKLIRNIKNDPAWKAYNFALGSENSKQLINVSANSHSSSILEISDTHTNAETSASYIGKQEIQIKTLDSVFDDIKGKSREIFLKIDTQGFELNVLKGAANSLSKIHTVQLEMSLQSLYIGQPLYKDVMAFLHSNDYTLLDVEPGFADSNTGSLLQFDGIFRKSKFIK
ncbi:MAG TPA: FkbM family methyltransferase [Bacteroidia bacterium]|jgi:FkbM family methyltransferase|nr:FkbM family methyltransferase [Bacteroidia bacterium]